ncbi:putative transcription factor C2H2 family [Helianthus annuus]|nr:putative transcription factor C2H2 family [Helianthus annuus]
MSYRYVIIQRRFKTFIIVNGEYSDPVYTTIDITPCESDPDTSDVEIFHYPEGIQTETLLIDEGVDDYKLVRLIFTSYNGSLLTSRYLALKGGGKAVDYVMDKGEYLFSIRFAKFVLWCDCNLNDYPKAIEDVVETSRFVKEKEDEEETCVVCLEEYQSDCIIGTLPLCKHSFHEECIKNWFKTTRKICPVCRVHAFTFDWTCYKESGI